MICDLVTDATYLDGVVCSGWEALVDIGGGLLVDDIAFFHGRPEAGVKAMAMSLVLLAEPVYLGEKRIKAAFTFAAVDKKSHLGLMRELGGCLQDEEFLELLRNGGPKSEVMKKLREGA